MNRPIRDIRVLEIEGSAAGSYAAKLFSQCGARVFKFLPAPSHREPGDGGNTSSTSLYLDHGKEVEAFDGLAGSESAQIRSRLEWADVVLESSAPDPLKPRTETDDFPQLVRVRISPFGPTGPYSSYRSNEFSDDAIGGQLYLNGEPDREPIGRPGLQSHYQAGLHAFIGAVSALRAMNTIGSGQLVEVSHFEGLASMHQHTINMWTYGQYILKRVGNRQPGIWHPAGIYSCKDGYVSLNLATGEHRDRFLIAAGIPEIVLDPRFANDLTVGQNKDAFDEAIAPWLMDHTCEEILAVSEESRTAAGPLTSPLQFLEDPHLCARRYWKPCGEFRIPGRAFSISQFARSTPTEEAQNQSPFEPPSSGDAHLSAHHSDSKRRPPLHGLRVLDLTRVWAGPLAGRLLADLGADVVVIETPGGRGPREVDPELAQAVHCFPADEAGEQPWNRIGFFNELNRNKRGITLDLKRPEAREIFKRLVKTADVVLENFSPRVMGELGLDLDQLRPLNPRLIHSAISGYGSSGPDRDRLAYGPVIESSVGTSHGIGYRDSGPYRSGVAWADPISALHAVAATLVALNDRESDRTPTARYVEIPMIEAMAAVHGEHLLEAQRRGEDPPRRGNRHPKRAPQGVYPCLGEDRWIAISIESDSDWRELCRFGDLAKFSGLDISARHAHHDEIDSALMQWTRTQDSTTLERTFQEAGIIAASLRNARDLCEDTQLSAREFWSPTVHREAGTHSGPGCAIHLSKTPVAYTRSAPCLGEHNQEVLGELLGLEEVERLSKLGILTDTPP